MSFTSSADPACPGKVAIVMAINPDGDKFTGTSTTTISSCQSSCAVKAKLSGKK